MKSVRKKKVNLLFSGVYDNYMQEIVNQLQKRGFVPNVPIQRGINQKRYPDTILMNSNKIWDLGYSENSKHLSQYLEFGRCNYV